MKNVQSPVAVFADEEEGASAVEYAILVAAIAAVIVVVTVVIGTQVESAFNTLCKAVANLPGVSSCE